MNTLRIEKDPWGMWAATNTSQYWLMEHFTHGVGVAQPDELDQLKAIAALHNYRIEIEDT